MTVSFRRDKAGNVATLDYSDPVVLNVKFTRPSDSTGGR